MNSAKRARDSSTVVGVSKQDRDNSDPQWSLENQQLETEAEANSRLRQQITKQSYADSSVQAQIKDKVNDLKQKAVKLAQKLQSEKRKNIELSAIIKHMVFVRGQQKKIQTQHRDDINFENVDNLLRKIKKLQYDLEQIFSKLNELTSKNKEKKNEVDTFRTQRVIDSGIFLKIEKEIIQYQTQYKKLLIEKTKFEQEYSKNLLKYKKMKADIEKQQVVNLSKREPQKQDTQGQQQFFMNIPEIEHAVKFTQVNQADKKKSFSTSKKNLTVFEAKRQQHHQQVEYAVKKVFLETGLNSVDTLIEYLKNIQQINEELFKQVNRDTDKISELSRSISELKTKKAEKTIKYYEKQPSLTKAQIKMRQAKFIENQIEKMQKSGEKQSSMLKHFIKTNQLRLMATTTSAEIPDDLQIENLQDFFASIEENMNDIISNYCQFKKDGLSSRKKLHRESQSKEETVEQLIGKIKKMEQSQKIMVRQDFKKQYERVLKSENSGKRKNGKKKTTIIKKS